MSGFGFSGEDLKGRFEADPGQDDSGWDDAQPPRFWQSISEDPRHSNSDPTSGGSAREPPVPWSRDVRITELPEGMRPGERSRRAHPGRMTTADAARAYCKSMPSRKNAIKARRQVEDHSKTAASDEQSTSSSNS